MPNFFINVKSKGAKKASGEIRGLTGNLNGMASAAKKAAVIFGVGFLGKQIFDIGKSAVNTAASFETLRVRLTSLYGSVQRGEQAFKKFNDVAATTPFMLQDVVGAGASLKAFGLDAEETIKPLADLAAFMQVDMSVAASNMGRAFVAGAGAADMFREKGVNQMIADMAGVTDATSLSIEDFRENMFKVLADPSSGIAGMTSKMADTWAGAVSNFQDGTDRLKAAIGDELIAVLRPKLDAINKELSKMGAIGWENIGSTFMDNSGIFIDMGAGVMGAGGKIMGISLVDGIGNMIEFFLPTKVEAITLGLRPLLAFLSDDVAKAMANIMPSLNEAFITFDDHDEVITKLFEDMQILMSEGYQEFIRLAEEQKIAVEGSTGALANDTDETNKNTDAKIKAKEAWKGFKSETIENMTAIGKLAGSLGQLNEASKGSALVTARLQQASIIASAASGAMAAISPPTGAPTPAGWMNFAAVIAAGVAQTVSISQSMGDFKKAATGMNEVVTRPTMILAGEAGAESVQITPLNSAMNVNGVQGGSNITLNISAPLVDDTVVDHIIPAINEAVRRGETLATS